MKDLFVELCLTVPVRLSSLLPYLPMLMDPLVSALNGSQTLISQVCHHLVLFSHQQHNVHHYLSMPSHAVDFSCHFSTNLLSVTYVLLKLVNDHLLLLAQSCGTVF